MPAPPKPQPLPRFPPQSPHASLRVAARMIHLNRNQFTPLSGSLSSATHSPTRQERAPRTSPWLSGKPAPHFHLFPPTPHHSPTLAMSGPLHLPFQSLDRFTQTSAQLQMSPPQRPSLTAVPAPRLDASHTSSSTPSQHQPLPVDLFLM